MNATERDALVREIAEWLRHIDRLDEIAGATAGLPASHPLWDASYAIERRFLTDTENLAPPVDAKLCSVCWPRPGWGAVVGTNLVCDSCGRSSPSLSLVVWDKAVAEGLVPA